VPTAAHLVQAADRIVVEFSRGELIPARVTGSAFSADVALLQLVISVFRQGQIVNLPIPTQ
jgi:S1-C subfamily serine protease